MSLIIFSLITLIGSVGLPWIVKSPEDEGPYLTQRPPPSLAPIVTEVPKQKPSLINAWLLSHFLFAFAMCLTPFVTSVRFATALVAISGM